MNNDMQERVSRVTEHLENNRENDALALIDGMAPAEIADMLEALPYSLRPDLWSLVPPETKGETLLELHGEIRRKLVDLTDKKELVASLSTMQMDELADLDEDLPMSIVNAMVQAMDAQRRQRYETVKDYPDDTAGGLMDADATAVRADVTLKAVLRYLRLIRRHEGELPEHLDSLMVVDRQNRYMGMLPLSNLVSLRLNSTVGQSLVEGIPSITPLTPAKNVARLFEELDLLSAPVVDDNGHLLGRITVDDVIDVLREEADQEILGRVGLEQHEDMFAPVIKSSARRAFWLGVNLATAFAAAWVIGLFEASIEKVVALAVLMPVVASMGGVAGTQTLTLVTRGIALDQVGVGNILRLLWNEMGIGLLNGLFWALVVALIALTWFGDLSLALIFGAALLIAILTGALAGTLIPLILKRMGIDPALAGGVVLTTATDVIGFFSFLGLATITIL
jgi:magnesium transporter